MLQKQSRVETVAQSGLDSRSRHGVCALHKKMTKFREIHTRDDIGYSSSMGV